MRRRLCLHRTDTTSAAGRRRDSAPLAECSRHLRKRFLEVRRDFDEERLVEFDGVNSLVVGLKQSCKPGDQPTSVESRQFLNISC